MCIAAAIIGGAVLGAGASLIAGSESAGAIKDASQTAAGVQYAALEQQKQLAAPYTGLGQDAISKYEALLGIGPAQGQAQTGPAPRGGPAGRGGAPGVDPSSGYRIGPGGQITRGIPGVPPGAAGSGAGVAGGTSPLDTLRNMPGYEFAKSQGLDATKAAASTMFGGGPSGNLLQSIDQFSTGLADQTYNQELKNLLAPIQIGQGAAAGQAANIQTGASNLGNIAIGQGNNLAGIYANETAGITRAIGNAGNQYLTYQTLQGLGGGGSPVEGDYGGGMSGGLMPAGGGYTYNAPGYYGG